MLSFILDIIFEFAFQFSVFFNIQNGIKGDLVICFVFDSIEFLPLSAFQVCLHMFTLDFLNQVANGLEKDSMSVILSFSSILLSRINLKFVFIYIYSLMQFLC